MNHAIAFLLTAALSAAGTEWETNLSAVADTGLYETAPTNNLGSVMEIPLGVHSTGKRSRLLLKFNPAAALPAGARVTSAELRLAVTASNPGSLSCHVHRVLRDWAEGTGFGTGNGAPAQEGETTWLARFHPASLWDAPGANLGTDFADTPSATATLGAGGSTNLLAGPALAADVQTWLDQPAANLGWILLAADESILQTARRIASRENTNSPPALTIRFRLGPHLYGTALEAGSFSFYFDAESDQAYAVEYCVSLAAPTWQTLTNFAPLVAPVTLHISDPAGTERRFYRVRLQ